MREKKEDKSGKDGKKGTRKPKRVPGVDSKGYLVLKAGPQRDIRVHTLVAEAILGRKLKPSEQVHHRDGNKLNNDWRNLQILDERDHGAVSSRQRWFFKQHDIRLKKDWDEFFEQANQPTVGELAYREQEVGLAAAAAAEQEGDTTFP